MMFSIIIPAYNAAGHIRKALDSIKAQEYKDYELIVVCDSCEDDTEKIAQEYGARTAAVKFHRDGLTRNVGLDMATGEYILFMDDDDWWLHEFVLTRLYREITYRRIAYNFTTKSNTPPDIYAFGFIWKGKGICYPTHDGGMYYPAVWNKCYRRDFIGDTRFNDKWSVSDLDFTLELFNKRPQICNDTQPLYYYNYMRKGSITERDSHEPCTED